MLNPLKLRDFNDSQPSNMRSMLSTLSVLKLLRSREFNELQPKNMYLMSVTQLVFKYVIPVMEDNLDIPLNQLLVEVGCAFANEGV